MSLYIRNEETDRLARELASRTGETITQAITRLLRVELDRTPPKACSYEEKLALVRSIQAEISHLPMLELGTDEELLYDLDGLPR